MFQASLFLNYYQTLCDAGFSLPIIWIKIKMMDDTLALIFLYKIGLTLMATFWALLGSPTAAHQRLSVQERPGPSFSPASWAEHSMSHSSSWWGKHW